jgi:hypothetical protein
VIEETDLEDGVTNSYYKAEGGVHGQDRDVSKFWKKSNIRIASFGFENQTASDSCMPLRVLSYDGASYRSQLLSENKDKDDDDNANANNNQKYPIVTLVLHFGKYHWKSPRTLYECLAIPKVLEPYVNDYKINVFEISYLTEEQVNMFKSDFKIVADFFVQTRKNANYCPKPEEITHVREVLDLLRVFTGDDRFEKTYNSLQNKEVITMCDVVDKFIEKGIMINKKDMILEMAEAGEPIEKIVRYTKVSEKSVKEVLKQEQAKKSTSDQKHSELTNLFSEPNQSTK